MGRKKYPRDIPDYLGKNNEWERVDLSTQKRELKEEAKKYKRNSRVKKTKIKSYKNVYIRSSPIGERKPRKLYALFVKRSTKGSFF